MDGAQVTVASNADWNRSISSGASFSVGFNGTFSGANNNPTSLTLNGTAQRTAFGALVPGAARGVTA
jgi:cellulose binding protein with CBM2 domain